MTFRNTSCKCTSVILGLNFNFFVSQVIRPHVMRVPVSTASRVHVLGLEETASMYGGKQRIYECVSKSFWTESILHIELKVKVKLFLCLTKHHTMKAYWELRYSSTHSLTSALDGGEWSASRPGRFTPSETAPGTH
jgi:hypothetical protein